MAKLWLQTFTYYLVFTTLVTTQLPFAVSDTSGDVICVGICGVVLSIGGYGLVAMTVELYRWYKKCPYSECCTENWVKPNITGLRHDLNVRLLGQHLVRNTAFTAIKGHVTNNNPEKALALSFNGCTGCGKNFVSKIIAENLYNKGMDSEYVHVLIATHHFPHRHELDNYKIWLKRRVIANIAMCPRSLFIFDEMDKMPEGLVDVLKPFLDHYPEIEGVDCRKAIFIFLSNTGARLINSAALENWSKGKDRNAITIKDMDKIINLGAFNEKGGFWHATLIEKHLIDYFIPFLPLERSHVKECVRVDLKLKHHSTNKHILALIADEMQYYPEDTKVFSTSGCKKVPSKVDLIIGQDD